MKSPTELAQEGRVKEAYEQILEAAGDGSGKAAEVMKDAYFEGKERPVGRDPAPEAARIKIMDQIQKDLVTHVQRLAKAKKLLPASTLGTTVGLLYRLCFELGALHASQTGKRS